MADKVVDVTRVGLWAPHGFLERQSLAQELSSPQLDTHCEPHSVQMKYGRVWLYSLTLGDRPLEQTQAYVSESGSQSLVMVSALSAGGWRQMLR